MRGALTLLAFAVVCSPRAFAAAQPVQDVSLCELRQHAADFDHKLVRVHGTTGLAFESFTLYGPDCKDTKSTSVWLTFGGDVSDIAVYCCGDHSREPGQSFQIDGQAVPMLKDAAFEQFYRLLRASRNRMPDGEPCTGDCHFYKVSATLTGVFLAEKDTANEHVGYGHLGCCSLLVIKRVEEVAAERTMVPVGAFGCEKSEWEASSEEVPELDAYLQCHSNCTGPEESLVRGVAHHWHDFVVFSNGSTNGSYSDHTGPHPIEHLNWLAGNMLIGYTILAEENNPAKLFVTRQVCHPAGKNESLSEAISCDEYVTARPWNRERKQRFDKLIGESKYGIAEDMVAHSAEQLSSQGDQSWRKQSLPDAAHVLLLRQLDHWGVEPDSNLRTTRCADPQSFPDSHYLYAGCSWYSPDGMQEFSVDMMRTDPLGSSASPWLFKGANGRVCHSDPSLTTANVH